MPVDKTPTGVARMHGCFVIAEWPYSADIDLSANTHPSLDATALAKIALTMDSHWLVRVVQRERRICLLLPIESARFQNMRTQPHRLRRPSDILLVAFLLVISSTSMIASPAGAFDQYAEFCGNDTTRTPTFEGPEWGWTWAPAGGPSGFTLADPFYWGWLQWVNEARGWDGQLIFNNGDGFEMDYVNSAQLNGAGAVAVCSWSNPLALVVGGPKIAVNAANTVNHLTQSQASLQGFSAHEWGHTFGLGHSGDGDSFGGGPPTMMTCNTALANQRINLSQDDHAAAAYLDELEGGFHSVTANSSFEQGAYAWGTSGASLSFINGGANGSPKAGVISSGNGNGMLQNVTRVTNQGAPFGNNSLNNDTLNVKIHYKDSSPSNSGYVRVEAWVRPVIYADGTDLNCNFYGDNKNATQHIGNWVGTALLCYPSSTWGLCTTSTLIAPNPGGYGGLDDPDAADVLNRVYNRTTSSSSGSATAVIVDRFRARWNF